MNRNIFTAYAKSYAIAGLLVMLMSCLCSCSPERKMQRLISKHPQLSRADTTTVTVTIYVPGDTLWRSVLLQDTVAVTNERQVVKIQRIRAGSPCDTAAIALDIQAQVKPDTVYRDIAVEVPRIVPCPPNDDVSKWWRTAALILAAFSLALFIMYRYQPHRNTH